jgi:hypothetical protein
MIVTEQSEILKETALPPPSVHGMILTKSFALTFFHWWFPPVYSCIQIFNCIMKGFFLTMNNNEQ